MCYRYALTDERAPMTREQAIERLCSHRAELERLGIAHIGLFGSVARGEADAASDVDVVIALRADARIGFGIVRIAERLEEILGASVDLVTDPIEKPRLRAHVERDRVDAF